MPQKNIPLRLIFPVFPSIQIVFTVKVLIK